MSILYAEEFEVLFPVWLFFLQGRRAKADFNPSAHAGRADPGFDRAYFSAAEINPYHWMLHESVHQLNREVAHLKLEKWLEEGPAEYFSTSRLTSNGIALGRIDPNTYPVWWIDELATSPNRTENIRNGSVIPLRSIITNRGGPSLNTHFNLYYLHWWTLTHFLFESPRCREHALEVVRRGGGLDAVEHELGPVDQVQVEWHTYVRDLKGVLSGGDLRLQKRQRLRQSTNSVPQVRAVTSTPGPSEAL